jgi:hypothetical protein
VRAEKFVDYGPLTALRRQRGQPEKASYGEYVESGLAETDEEMKRLVREGLRRRSRRGWQRPLTAFHEKACQEANDVA